MLPQQCDARQENGIRCVLQMGHPPLDSVYEHNYGGLPKLNTFITQQTPTRTTWPAIWLTVAHGIAQRSLCTRDKVGAVIVSSDNTPLMGSYNGPSMFFEHHDKPCTEWCPRAQSNIKSELGKAAQDYVYDPSYNDCPALHAEANAISRSSHIHRKGGTIYVTSDVCFTCAKLISNSGITEVVVDRRTSPKYRNPRQSYDYLINLGIRLILIEEDEDLL